MASLTFLVPLSFLIGACVFFPPALLAQRDSAARLDPVVVTVTRTTGRSVLGSPFAVTIIKPDSARPGQRHVAIDETLAIVPGLIAVNRNNPSQDARLSIRGFGARSAFGVRGIRVLRDGMPLTLPDGQTPLDYLSLESVGRVEVMRGAASALYGNASGGVIDLRTAEAPASPLSAGAKQWIGPNRSVRTSFEASGNHGLLQYTGDVGHTRSNGERSQSRQRATTGFFRLSSESGGTKYSLTALALDNPLAENPGALTLDEMRRDRTLADPLSVRRNARKAVKQLQIGVSASRIIGVGDVTLSAFGGARSLDNPLTFAVVEVGRHSYGASGILHQSTNIFGVRHNLVAGTDAQWQNDLRRNFATCRDTVVVLVATPTCPFPGVDRGIVTLDQRELVSGAGVYASDEVELGSVTRLTAAVRADRVRFEVRDRLITASNRDDSGDRVLGSLSPIVGIVARFAPSHSLYVNFSEAFETPTATELGNHADGSAGINSDLDPQRSKTFEVGIRGFGGTMLHYDAAVFATRVRDELVPFEIPASNGRRYYRNAGRTSRTGAEFGGGAASGPASLVFAYTYSRFRFVEYAPGGINLSGNTIPGIPSSRFQSALTLAGANRFVVFENEAASSLFTDDANSAKSERYVVSNVRAGWSVRHATMDFGATGGVMNVFDRRYSASAAVNAARGRFYEPALPRTFFIGLSLGGTL